MTTPSSDLKSAMELHQRGQLAQAQEIYRRILATRPDHAEAWHLAGVASLQQGNLSAAVDALCKAIELDGKQPASFRYLAEAYWSAGQPADAEAALRQALRLKSDDASLNHTLGTVQSGQGKHLEAIASYRRSLELNGQAAHTHFDLAMAQQAIEQKDEAIASFRRALELKPDFAKAHCNLGVVLQSLGRNDEAVYCYQRALHFDDKLSFVHNNMGNVLREQGRLDEAAAAYGRAIALEPGLLIADFNLGVVREEQGQWEQARGCFERVLAAEPDRADILCHLGNVLIGLHQHKEAKACFERALELSPGMLVARVNLANVLQAQGHMEAAEAAYREILAEHPESAPAHSNLGTLFRVRGQYDEALRCYERALAIEPEHVGARLNRSLVLLVRGDLASGLVEYEARWLASGASPRPREKSEWQGEPLDDRVLLAYAEQGLGDTLQFIRYVKLLRERGERVVCRVPQLLVRLLRQSGFDNVVGGDEPLPHYDVHAGLVSLPRLFGTTVETIPAGTPYLSADPALVERWRRELGRRPSFKVGVAWQGSPFYRADRFRSPRLRMFAPLAQQGVELISLQKGLGIHQLAEVAPKFQVRDLGRFDEDHGAFMDTAAIMQNLDLVVTSDSAIAHLAGALGVPVWVALPLAPDWRWLTEREDTPWYPSMRLFRQSTFGNWQDVFDRMAAELERATGER